MAWIDGGRRVLAYDGRTGTVRLLNFDTGEELLAAVVTNPQQPASEVLATPDGRFALVNDVTAGFRQHLSLDPHIGKPAPIDPLAGRKLRRIVHEDFESTPTHGWPSRFVCEHAATIRQVSHVTDNGPYFGRRCLQLWGVSNQQYPYAAVSFLSVPKGEPIRALRARVRVGSGDTLNGHNYRAHVALKTEASNERGGIFDVLRIGRFGHRWGPHCRLAHEWLTLTVFFDISGEFVKVSAWIDGDNVRDNTAIEIKSADFPNYHHVKLAAGAELVWYDDLEVFVDATP